MIEIAFVTTNIQRRWYQTGAKNISQEPEPFKKRFIS